MFDLKGKHEHVFLSILNKYIYALIRSSTEHTLFNIINYHKKTQTPNILGSARQTCSQQSKIKTKKG